MALKIGSEAFRRDLAQLRRLARYLVPYRSRLIVGLVAGAVFGSLAGGFPKAVEVVFHRLFESGSPPRFWTVLGAGLAIPAYFAVRGVLGFLSTYALSWVGTRMLRDLRMELYSQLQAQSMDFFVRRRVGDMIQMVHNSTQLMQVAMVQLAGDIVKQPVTIVVAFVVLAYINAWFLLVALGLGAMCLIPMLLVGRKVRQASLDEDQRGGQVIGVLHESFSNVRVIKAYLLEETQYNKFSEATRMQMETMLRFARQREMLSPTIEWIGSLGVGGSLLYAYFADIKSSTFLAMMAGLFTLYDPLKKLGRIHVQSQRIMAIAGHVFEIIDREANPAEKSGTIELTSFEDEIRYEGVTLRYGEDRTAVEQLDLTIPRGSVCALVGPSGAGKTSVVNLLLRFYEPSEGQVRIDGHDLKNVTATSIRRLIGLVTQETLLFSDTVANNIALGRPGASREEIVAAAKQAHADEFICTMPQGYDTVLSDRGQNLSGGQCQRIAIARAFLKNPAILVLDEATSALDAQSELQVREAMVRLTQGRTVIIIAHRLATVRHADQFVVLDEGRMVDRGTHEELINREGLYRRLYELQLL